MEKILKECVFISLFIIVLILLIAIIFYEFVPKEIIPEATKYQQSSSTAKLISQIKEENNSENQEEKQENVLKSYEVTSDELNYSENQAEYVKGKNHPFYDYTQALSTSNSSNSEITTDSNSNTTNSETSNNTISNQLVDVYTHSAQNTNTTNKINTNTLRDTAESNKTSK